LASVHAGQLLAGLGADDPPFAMAFGMDGLFCVMKLPQISEVPSASGKERIAKGSAYVELPE
jgi:hypothetical protein